VARHRVRNKAVIGMRTMIAAPDVELPRGRSYRRHDAALPLYEPLQRQTLDARVANDALRYIVVAVQPLAQ
jgi:hypothetical protein